MWCPSPSLALYHVKVVEFEDFRLLSGISASFTARSKERILLRRGVSGEKRDGHWGCVGHRVLRVRGFLPGGRCGSRGCSCRAAPGAPGLAGSCFPKRGTTDVFWAACETDGSGAVICASDWNLKNLG